MLRIFSHTNAMGGLFGEVALDAIGQVSLQVINAGLPYQVTQAALFNIKVEYNMISGDYAEVVAWVAVIIPNNEYTTWSR